MKIKLLCTFLCHHKWDQSVLGWFGDEELWVYPVGTDTQKAHQQFSPLFCSWVPWVSFLCPRLCPKYLAKTNERFSSLKYLGKILSTGNIPSNSSPWKVSSLLHMPLENKCAFMSQLLSGGLHINPHNQLNMHGGNEGSVVIENQFCSRGYR